MLRMTPFKEDGKSIGIDDLTVENRIDSVEMFGSLSISKDKEGLKRARELKEILDATLAALEAEKNLPDKVEKLAPKKKKNPFG
jgi:phosphoribosylpyrophosphate synthetase